MLSPPFCHAAQREPSIPVAGPSIMAYLRTLFRTGTPGWILKNPGSLTLGSGARNGFM